jgi:phosphoribosylamine--glycine ligase
LAVLDKKFLSSFHDLSSNDRNSNEGRCMRQARVHVLMGSKNDLEAIQASGMLSVLKKVVGEEFLVSVCSAHRNTKELDAYVSEALQKGAQVFVGVAGMAAALPGALAGLSGMRAPVIAVPLDEHGIDSCLYMPPGVPVLTAGIGTAGLKNAALAVCQVLAVSDRQVQMALREHLISTAKQPEFDINHQPVKS